MRVKKTACRKRRLLGGTHAINLFERLENRLLLFSANQPPAIHSPTEQVVVIGQAVAFGAQFSNSITVSDPDAGENAIRIQLNSSRGVLSLIDRGGDSGLTFSQGDGTKDSSMVFDATIEDANQALSWLLFEPETGYSGPDSEINILVNDLGNVGTGGAKSDEARIEIVFQEREDYRPPEERVPGAIDTSFGTQGKLEISWSNQPLSSVAKLIPLPNGNTLAIGHALMDTRQDIAVASFKQSGELDATFGNQGLVTISAPDMNGSYTKNYLTVLDAILGIDGKVTVVGSRNPYFPARQAWETFALKLTTAGSVDTSFGTNGIVSIELSGCGGGFEQFHSVTMQADGSLLFAGMDCKSNLRMWRLSNQGQSIPWYDGSIFFTSGLWQEGIGSDFASQFSATHVLSKVNGKISVLQNRPDGKIHILQFNQNGTFDENFGTNGVAVIDFGLPAVPGRYDAFLIDNVGNFYIAGTIQKSLSATWNDSRNGFVAKVDADGVLDGAFGNSGIKKIILSSSVQQIDSIYLYPDGRVLGAGWMTNPVNTEFLLVSLLSDGNLDANFDADGIKRYDASESYPDKGTSLLVQNDGRVLIAGSGRQKSPIIRIYGDYGNYWPTLDVLNNQVVNEDASQQTVNLSGITAGGNESQPLRVTAKSSNISLIPNPSVNYTSANTTGSISFAPMPDHFGLATITVTVEDGGLDGNLSTTGDNATYSRTFQVTVNPVNDLPTLDSLNNITINQNAPEQAVNLSGITAGGHESQPLRVTASSNNTGLIPNPTVNYTSANTTGSISFTPVANQSGVATITVTVEDGGLDGNLNTTADNATFSRTFTVSVTPPPEITVTGPVGPISENNSGTQTVYFTVSLSAASTETVKVNYATTVSGYANAATPVNDFTPVSGLIEFAPGETSKSIPVLVRGDRSIELDELFGLLITNPVNGQLGVDLADLIITDDDSWSFPQEIDFGTEVSPLKSGAVALGALPFTSAKGLGWTAGLNNLQVVDRGLGSAGLRDIVLTSNSSFALNVPNGTYILRLTFGDAIKAHDQMRVTVEGSNKPLINTAVNQFITRIFTTTVSDGRLDLSFADMGGADPQVAITGIAFGRR
jgi:uncharacterized delta-60 repeat protein